MELIWEFSTQSNKNHYPTNNGDASGNVFILNTLFYRAFAGTNVGTLNTIGIKGELKTELGWLIGAITNGTDETTLNNDGNFEVVLYGPYKKLSVIISVVLLISTARIVQLVEFQKPALNGKSFDVIGFILAINLLF